MNWEEEQIARKIWLDDATEAIHLVFWTQLEEKAEWLCRHCGVEWSENMTKCLGKFKVEERRQLGIDYMCIRLSWPLWQRATPQERWQTAVHEACHIVHYVRDGRLAVLMFPHSGGWSELMLACGVPPEKYHKVDRTGLRRRQPRYLAQCTAEWCGREYHVTRIIANKMIGGQVRTCRRCRSVVELVLTRGKLTQVTEGGSA